MSTPKGPRPAAPAPGDRDAEADCLLDLACGGLSPAEAQALAARLEGDAALRAQQAGLGRLIAASRDLGEVAPEAGLARRIALRVRDQVAHEETQARREAQRAAPRGAFGLSLKARVRLLLASVAVHVLLLGWLVFRQPESQGGAGTPRVDVAIVPPRERLAPDAGEVFEPLDLGPVVAAEEIPDSLLVDVGLAEPGLGEVAGQPPFRVAEHPQPVQLEMLVRSRAGVRSQRLARAGATPREATEVVTRGLGAIALQQRPDGSFPVDGTLAPEQRSGLGTPGVTALAALPFLGEGRRSAPGLGEAADPVVGRAIAWLRSAAAAAGAAGPASWGADDVALCAIALCEDYMLSYGRLPPAETTQRGREIARLIQGLAARQRADGSFEAAEGARAPFLWPLLALDAARHTGLAVEFEEAGQRLKGWIERQPRTAEGLPANAAGRGDTALAAAEVLASRLPVSADRMRAAAAAIVGEAGGGEATVGTLAGALALYRSDAQLFTRWNRAASDALMRRVGPTGLVARGDTVVETALTLLALQAAYRLY